jgi:uncharacterized protein with von Willebrand factor type A (vWA) domain
MTKKGMLVKSECVFFNASIFLLDDTAYGRFNDLLVQAKQLHEICLEGEYYQKDFTQIAGDIWVSFYSYEPLMKKTFVSSKSAHVEFIEQLSDLHEFKTWSHLTQLDPLLSILATITLCEQLVNDLKRDERTKKQALERKLAEGTMAYATKRLTQDENDRLNGNQSTFRMQSSLKMLKQAAIDIDKNSTSANQVVKRFINRLPSFMQKASNDLQKKRDAVHTFCSMDGKKIEHVPLKEQFLVAEQLSKQELLREIAELAGRFKKIAKKKMKTPSQFTLKCHDLSLGNEISRTIPLELAKYISPQSKVEFLKRYAESQLFIFNKKGKERKGKGPIIICMDESSSMNAMKAESKAFCLALLRIAKQQKRDLAIVPFASTIGNTLFFVKGQSTTEMLLQFSQSFLGGGTNFEKPLRESLNILLKSKFNEADLLFVTDGSSFLTQSFIEEFGEIKRRRKFECTAIILTKSYSVNLDVVKRFSDNVIEVNNLFEAEAVFSIT